MKDAIIVAIDSSAYTHASEQEFDEAEYERQKTKCTGTRYDFSHNEVNHNVFWQNGTTACKME